MLVIKRLFWYICFLCFTQMGHLIQEGCRTTLNVFVHEVINLLYPAWANTRFPFLNVFLNLEKNLFLLNHVWNQFPNFKSQNRIPHHYHHKEYRSEMNWDLQCRPKCDFPLCSNISLTVSGDIRNIRSIRMSLQSIVFLQCIAIYLET